jgi:hypothetical protein
MHGSKENSKWKNVHWLYLKMKVCEQTKEVLERQVLILSSPDLNGPSMATVFFLSFCFWWRRSEIKSPDLCMAVWGTHNRQLHGSLA